MSTIFFIAGFSMFACLVFSAVLLALLGGAAPSESLFATPNRWLGKPPSYMALRLLRAKYFLPWVAAPAELEQHPASVRVFFWLARISGAIFPVAMGAFFAGAFLVSAE